MRLKWEKNYFYNAYKISKNLRLNFSEETTQKEAAMTELARKLSEPAPEYDEKQAEGV